MSTLIQTYFTIVLCNSCRHLAALLVLLLAMVLPPQLNAVEPLVVNGYDFSAYLAADGTVWTWGANGYGQLGDGTTNNRSTPVGVSGPSD